VSFSAALAKLQVKKNWRASTVFSTHPGVELAVAVRTEIDQSRHPFVLHLVLVMRSSVCLTVGTSFLVALAACSSDTTSPNVPSPATCTGASFTLAPLEGRIVAAADLPCLSVPADGGTYVIVPQFPTATAPMSPVNFSVAAGATTSARVVTASRHALPRTPRPISDLGRAQRDLDRKLRQRERTMAAAARGMGAASGPLASRARADVAAPPLGSTKTFHVLSDFSSTTQYKLDTATLKYAGSHLLVYQSKNAPASPNGFTDAQITAIGNTFDQELYTVDVSTFGSPTDIDGNGRVIVLLSPIINSLTNRNSCQTQGYIAGFFDAVDLLPDTQQNSNGAEIFYALVPDPMAQFSCVHNIATVGEITPATFIHEFQHMISFGQHAIMRDGNEEDAWLNEGLSHIAEELGARFYEHRYPPPTGRTNPSQLFPDSSQGFISGDLDNSYNFLLDPTSTDTSDLASVSNWGDGDGTLVQRGGVWLFLRWLGDQQDSTVYGRLDQTSLTGTPNVENASSTSFATLFGEYALALYVDSLPGIPRASIPSQFRYSSRNLRALYARENQLDPGDFPLAFPIAPTPLAVGSSVQGSMYPGTMDYYLLTAPTSGAATTVSFTPRSGSSFSSTLNAQVTVFKCPSAAACQ
jgi:hypothetical protein